MMVVNVPIESIEDRYSADWNKWFEQYIGNHKVENVKTIYPGALRSTIKEGDFLDITNTVYFKSKQIASIARKVDEGEIPRDEKVVFLIQDGWFPIEQLAYLRDMLSCHYWKFVGIFHAGTYSKYDLTARSHMYTWGEDLENSWFKIYDKIIVGSQHHRLLLLQTRNIPGGSWGHKIVVIPWHVEVPQLDLTKKEDIVVFPHRLGVEKQPDLFTELAVTMSRGSSWRFVKTVDICKTKQEYYKLLAKSKIAVSLGLEELYGIAMVEATLLGCIPLVSNAFSYKEKMYKSAFRYADIPQLKFKLKAFMESTPEVMLLEVFEDFYYEARKLDFFQQVFNLMEEL